MNGDWLIPVCTLVFIVFLGWLVSKSNGKVEGKWDFEGSDKEQRKE